MKSRAATRLLSICLLVALPVSAAPQAREGRSEILQAYRATIEKYRRGDNVGALKELLAHDDRRWVEEAFDALLESRDGSIGELQAATLMHTEVMLAKWLPAFDAGFHLTLAAHLIDLPSPAGAGEFRLPEEFRRQWHLVVAWALQSDLQFTALIDHLEATVERYPNDPDVLVTQGAFYELFAWSQVPRARSTKAAPQLFSAETRTRRGLLLEAERVFRTALAESPDLEEPRLRLGRVLTELDRPDEALEFLTPLRAGATDLTFRYLAELFAGAAEQRAGRLTAAAVAYQLAAGMYPRCQTPRVALSAVRRSQGEPAVAYDMVLTASSDASGCGDPWWHYKFGQAAWRLNRLLDEMRLEIAR